MAAPAHFPHVPNARHSGSRVSDGPGVATLREAIDAAIESRFSIALNDDEITRLAAAHGMTRARFLRTRRCAHALRYWWPSDHPNGLQETLDTRRRRITAEIHNNLLSVLSEAK